MKLIQVLGPGCPKCNELEKNAKDAVAEAGIEAKVEKVTDFKEITAFGVFSTPALVIDGQVKAVGKAPSTKEIVGWLG